MTTRSSSNSTSHPNPEMTWMAAVVVLTGVFYALIWWFGPLGGAMAISTLVVTGGAILFAKAKGQPPAPAAD